MERLQAQIAGTQVEGLELGQLASLDRFDRANLRVDLGCARGEMDLSGAGDPVLDRPRFRAPQPVAELRRAASPQPDPPLRAVREGDSDRAQPVALRDPPP